jgi:predicted transposase YbfD/YdcC
MGYLRAVDKEESGIYLLSEDIGWLGQKKEWARLAGIGCVRRTLEKWNGETVTDPRYFIVGITDEGQFAASARGHWEVENKLHWQLYFTFKDDQNTITEKHGVWNLQTMKRTALAILSLAQSFYKHKSLKGIRYMLSLRFEGHIERIFKLLNARTLQDLLLPRRG